MPDHPSPEFVRAEHAYRGERVRELFAGGTSETLADRARERKRLETEARAAKEDYQRRRDHDAELRWARAEQALADFDARRAG